jgi:hypothetical protein
VNSVEEICNSDDYIASETYGERIRIVGLTQNKRMITITLNEESQGNYYIITARNSTNKESLEYKSHKEVSAK